MKKQFAVFAALLILSASVAPAFAGGPAYHSSQRRTRAKADAMNKKMTDAWQKFDAEMDTLKKDAGKLSAKTDGKHGSK
ncbi:MAG: hypothetical protein V1792_00010 [Pseudomonadota bacterium]